MRHRRGFTLTELLVVIGIIVVLMSVLTPMATRAWRSADRTRTAADLAAIGTALEAYKQDFGNYPAVSAEAFSGGPMDFNGARMLCRALIGPGPAVSGNTADVADGKGTVPANRPATDPETEAAPGFRVGSDKGRVYGPYLPPDRFKLGDAAAGGMKEPGYLAILDKYNRPILYYPARGKPNVRVKNAYVGDWGVGYAPPPAPKYNARDNIGAMPLATMRIMLGDTNGNGLFDTGEEPKADTAFLLWCAGPDEVFGPPSGSNMATPDDIRKAVQKSDDVTNFGS